MTDSDSDTTSDESAKARKHDQSLPKNMSQLFGDDSVVVEKPVPKKYRQRNLRYELLRLVPLNNQTIQHHSPTSTPLLLIIFPFFDDL